jgi:hypothetical protein
MPIQHAEGFTPASTEAKAPTSGSVRRPSENCSGCEPEPGQGKLDRKEVLEETRGRPVRAMDGSISNFVAVKHDITERKQAEAQANRMKEGLLSLNNQLIEANENILRLSQTDALTGLANRRTRAARAGTRGEPGVRLQRDPRRPGSLQIDQ